MLTFVNFYYFLLTFVNFWPGKTFPVGWVVGGWVRNTENKAQLRLAVAGALPELGNIGVQLNHYRKKSCFPALKVHTNHEQK